MGKPCFSLRYFKESMAAYCRAVRLQCFLPAAAFLMAHWNIFTLVKCQEWNIRKLWSHITDKLLPNARVHRWHCPQHSHYPHLADLDLNSTTVWRSECEGPLNLPCLYAENYGLVLLPTILFTMPVTQEPLGMLGQEKALLLQNCKFRWLTVHKSFKQTSTRSSL